jgi:hypothetical protein
MIWGQIIIFIWGGKCCKIWIAFLQHENIFIKIYFQKYFLLKKIFKYNISGNLAWEEK